jgi:hypothetical protein
LTATLNQNIYICLQIKKNIHYRKNYNVSMYWIGGFVCSVYLMGLYWYKQEGFLFIELYISFIMPPLLYQHCLAERDRWWSDSFYCYQCSGLLGKVTCLYFYKDASSHYIYIYIYIYMYPLSSLWWTMKYSLLLY